MGSKIFPTSYKKWKSHVWRKQMHKLGKKITCHCHGPIAVGKQYKSLWEDVWLTWTEKPGRKKKTIGPTLISKTDILREIEFEKEFLEEYPEHKDTSILEELETALREVGVNEYHIIRRKDNDLPSVYTNAEYIDRKEAEIMIRVLMIDYGYNNIRLKWKRPHTVIIPS
jgi:hypothetical protein